MSDLDTTNGATKRRRPHYIGPLTKIPLPPARKPNDTLRIALETLAEPKYEPGYGMPLEGYSQQNVASKAREILGKNNFRIGTHKDQMWIWKLANRTGSEDTASAF